MSSRATLAWRYWFVTALLLTAVVAGWGLAMPLAIALSAVQIGHFLYRERSLAAFPTQVRIGYLLWMLAAQWPPLEVMFWILFVGTWANVLAGYCPLARMMSLLPWNRTLAFSPRLVWTVFFTPPVQGSILQLVRRPATG